MGERCWWGRAPVFPRRKRRRAEDAEKPVKLKIMRKVFPIFILLLAGAATAQTPAPAQNSKSLASSVNESENAKKARAILQQMVQALGGPAYLGIQDMSQEGRIYTY